VLNNVRLQVASVAQAMSVLVCMDGGVGSEEWVQRSGYLLARVVNVAHAFNHVRLQVASVALAIHVLV
jgi:hypothetical protein